MNTAVELMLAREVNRRLKLKRMRSEINNAIYKLEDVATADNDEDRDMQLNQLITSNKKIKVSDKGNSTRVHFTNMAKEAGPTKRHDHNMLELSRNRGGLDS